MCMSSCSHFASGGGRIFVRSAATSAPFQNCSASNQKIILSSTNIQAYPYARPTYRPTSLIVHQPWSGFVHRRNTHTRNNINRYMSSSEITRGTDLLADSLAHGPRRKIVLESYAPSGVDVKGFIQVGAQPDDDDDGSSGDDKLVHMNGSIVAFPDACFLMNIKTAEDVTLESLSVVKLYQPTVEYLFIGCELPLPPSEMNKIKSEFRKKDVVVEQMDIMNCIGTFNILNGEDRRVACVLVVDPADE